ncbi:MAG: efflux transporter outer membrane subunit [Betaproteobacteria bacterium]|nr:efflux transporter outer membrane subunit [Betaproteobacteria bacterium]
MRAAPPLTGLARVALAAALAATAAGCALKSPPPVADLQKEALAHTAVPAAFKATGGVAAPLAQRWLASFNDQALSALVDEALTFNADLQGAALRVERAGGYLKVAGAALLPQVGAYGTGSGATSNSTSGLNGLWVSASLELDIWGRIRYGQAAAQADAEALAADYAYARQSLAAMVAKSWFVATEAGLQRAIVQDMVRSSESLLSLSQDRLRVGNGTEQDVAVARANVGPYRDMLRQADLSREQALRALELLLGRYPAAELAVAQSLSAMPAPVPVGLPSELLERRPDVVAAERRVAAAFNRIGEARAARLPRISLTAGSSTISSDVIVLQDRDNPAWGLGINLLAPIYQGGALRAQVDIRTTEQKLAVPAYARAGQRAFGEVENALAAEFALNDREAILQANVRDNERALELAKNQFRVGSADRRAVEQRQLSLQSARTSLLRVQSERLAQRVNLHLALGGDFSETTAGPVAAR